MNGWSKEDLEEMFGDDIIEQLAFVSGCHQHQLCNGNPSGWIIPEESLRKFAELIVRECCVVMFADPRLGDVRSATRGCARSIKEHFGVEE